MELCLDPSAYVMISEARKHLAKDGIGNWLVTEACLWKTRLWAAQPTKFTIPRRFFLPRAR